MDSGPVPSRLSYRAEPKDFLPTLGRTPVGSYILAAGYSGNDVIGVPTAGRDLVKFIMCGKKTSLLEDWALECLLK